MIELSLAEVAQAVGGRLADGAAPDARVTGEVVVDSRSVRPGGLFVAVPGERVDGHDFAGAAVEAGAVAVLATRPLGVPAVLVDDGVRALGALAHEVLARLPEATVVGITGSSGKTSTKDLTAHLLTRLGPTVAPPGSYNNEIGHPLTVLRADGGTRQLVLECSARGIGHIAMLCRIAPPRLGVVLNVGSAHLGEFGSREAIAQAKGELVEALPADGVAVLNADDPLVRAMASRTQARTVYVGQSPTAGVRASDVRLDEHGRAAFTLEALDERVAVRLALVGGHHVGNALAATAVALELGLPLPEVADALGTARPASRWRMEVSDRGDGVTVVNDAYNANPESMRAALDALVAMAHGRRTWAVLGGMAELGESSDAAHAEVGAAVAALGVDRLVVVGPAARPVADAAAAHGAAPAVVDDVDAAAALLGAELRPGDVVLVKASRSQGLERVASAVLAAAPAGPSGGTAGGTGASRP